MNTTTNYSGLEVREYFVDTAVGIAAHILDKPELRDLPRENITNKGYGFGAFLLGTEALRLAPEELYFAFEDSHVLQASCVREAELGLYNLLGVIAGYKFAEATASEGVEQPLPHWDADRTREQVARQFVLVELSNECHVFDLDVIHGRLNR